MSAAADDRVPALVLCNSVSLGESLAVSLHLATARVLPLRICTSDLPGLGASPRIAVMVIVDAVSLRESIATIRSRFPEIRVLAVGVEDQERSILEAFTVGADGVVLVSETLPLVKRAVDEVLRFGFRPPPWLGDMLVDRLIWARMTTATRSAKVLRLTRREIEILGCLARGASNKDVAVELHIEVQTVKNHINRILRRLGVRSRFDAVRLLARGGEQMGLYPGEVSPASHSG